MTQNSITALLPPPFSWIDIPAGDVCLDHAGGYLLEAKTVHVDAFAIAKYPITHDQFQAFIDADDGYVDSRWWDYSDDARDWRLEYAAPKKMDYGGGDHPRTHLAWYEAVAFCRWLSAKTGDTIRLPTDAEWQRAAQGDDGRLYTWGDEWDGHRCQNNVARQQIGTVPVTTFEGQGDSPFGVVDLTGNVWEWCATNWSTGDNMLTGDDSRVLRGGSWFDDVQRFFRATTRSSWTPDSRSDLRGFRIVRV